MCRAVAPDEDCIAGGAKFRCQIDRGGSHSGAVLDEQGILRWRYRTRRYASGWSLGNPLNKPDFVIAEPDEKAELIIRRASFTPSAFSMIEAGRVIGRISMRSIFLNKYSITIDGVNSWTFRMPLFTVRFYGESSGGAEIWVAPTSEREWNILIKPGVKEWPLVAALSFIHNQRYYYS